MELASDVKNLTEAIEGLPKLFSAIAGLADNSVGIFVAIVLFIFLLVNLLINSSKLFDTLERKERRRIEQINDYLSQPDIADPGSLAAVKDQRDAHYFRVATGLYAEGKSRSAYINIHKKLSHSISWKHIIRARDYIDIADDQSVTVRDMTRFETFGYWYNHLICILGMAISIPLAVLAFNLKSDASAIKLAFLCYSVLAALFAFFAFSQNWPVYAKNNIKKELDALCQDVPEAKPDTD